MSSDSTRILFVTPPATLSSFLFSLFQEKTRQVLDRDDTIVGHPLPYLLAITRRNEIVGVESLIFSFLFFSVFLLASVVQQPGI